MKKTINSIFCRVVKLLNWRTTDKKEDYQHRKKHK